MENSLRVLLRDAPELLVDYAQILDKKMVRQLIFENIFTFFKRDLTSQSTPRWDEDFGYTLPSPKTPGPASSGAEFYTDSKTL